MLRRVIDKERIEKKHGQKPVYHCGVGPMHRLSEGVFVMANPLLVPQNLQSLRPQDQKPSEEEGRRQGEGVQQRNRIFCILLFLGGGVLSPNIEIHIL